MIDSSIPSSQPPQVSPIASRPTELPRGNGAPERDTLSTAGLVALRSALGSEPAVRPDVIEKGRALAGDPTYPPADILRHVASLIVSSPDYSSDES